MNIKETGKRILVALVDYTKGLLKLSALTFLLYALGLNIIGISWWGLKAFLIAVVDFLPLIGSGIIMLPWALIRALTGSVEIGGQLALLYIIVTIIRFIAEPIIIGKSVGLHPILTFIITIGATIIFGPVGAIVAGFITVPIKVIWDIYSGKSAYSKLDEKEDSNSKT